MISWTEALKYTGFLSFLLVDNMTELVLWVPLCSGSNCISKACISWAEEKYENLWVCGDGMWKAFSSQFMSTEYFCSTSHVACSHFKTREILFFARGSEAWNVQEGKWSCVEELFWNLLMTWFSTSKFVPYIMYIVQFETLIEWNYFQEY